MEKPKLEKSFVAVDNRGNFSATILSTKIVQTNVSFNNKKYTFRGMHYQVGSSAQTKIVKVIKGSILDFVVDMRPNSEEYKSSFVFVLNEGDQLTVPKGFAHGFLTMTDDSVIQYLVDYPYVPSADRSVSWKSIPEIKRIIDELLKESGEKLIISEKDDNAPKINYEAE